MFLIDVHHLAIINEKNKYLEEYLNISVNERISELSKGNRGAGDNTIFIKYGQHKMWDKYRVWKHIPLTCLIAD